MEFYYDNSCTHREKDCAENERERLGFERLREEIFGGNEKMAPMF